MAQWEIRLSQPVGATPAIPAVTLSLFGADGYKRSTILPYSQEGTTIGGAGVVEGDVTGEWIHEWELTSIEDESVVLGLEALVWWQQRQLHLRQDGRLLLQDEVEYTTPVSGTHPKTLVGGSTITVATGITTGFVIAKVLVSLPEQHREHIGVAPDGTYGKRVSILAREVLG